MKLVIDVNVAFSLVKKDSSSRKLMKDHKLELYSHPALFDELREHVGEFCSNIGISEDKFERIISILSKLITFEKPSPQILNRARSMMVSDKDDAPYVASAIKLCCAIWSNDPHLKEQSVVKVFTTEELSKELKSRE